MEIFYPKYYDNFVCLADRCPDSCCKEWGVDVDDTTATCYRNLSGPLGDRLRQVLQDTDDGTVMAIENGRCPMWQSNGLCRIQAELGHDALCKVCREFPRLRHDYGDFMELDLALSCPEAARLILAERTPACVQQSTSEDISPEYDTQIMDILRRTRREFLHFLDTATHSFPQILAVLLVYAHDVQEELDGGATAVLNPADFLADVKRYMGSGNIQNLQEFFLQMEILTPEWKARLASPAQLPQWDGRFMALLRYFLHRYYLQAVSDYDVLCRVKFAIAACLLIGYLGGDLVETAQQFSKEIENDPDNVEAILDGAYRSPALTDLALLGLMRG